MIDKIPNDTKAEIALKHLGKYGEVPQINPEFSIKEARFILTDLCPYSCSWCGVFAFKQHLSNKMNDESYRNRDVGANEGDMIRDYKKVKREYLSAQDYVFLTAVLSYYFNTSRVTLTGGEAMIRKDFRQISDQIHVLGVKIKALTKGAPLFNIHNPDDIRRKVGMIHEIVFSLDTLDEHEYASNCLPLLHASKAKKYLPKTMEAIKVAVKAGYEVGVNMVVPKINIKNKDEKTQLFKKMRQMIEFALSNGVRRLKFIELDTKEIRAGNYYIENYLTLFISEGYLNGLPILSLRDFNEWDTTDKSKIKFSFADLSNTYEPMSLIAHRCTCPATLRLAKPKEKLCEYSVGSPMYLNSGAEIVMCQAASHDASKRLSIRREIIERDIKGIVRKIQQAENIIQKQSCPDSII